MPHILMVGGTGRNVGKTEWICSLLRAAKGPGAAVLKISIEDGLGHHAHEPLGVRAETDRTSGTDTARMLQAGASTAWRLVATRESLEAGLTEALARLPEGSPVICESNSARQYVQPGVFIVVRGGDCKESCRAVTHWADRVVVGHGAEATEWQERIGFAGGRWWLRHDACAAVLAGGESRRMRVDKGLLPWHGKPLIQGIVDQLDPQFDRIIIGANDPLRYAFLNRSIVPDRESGQGPLMGTACCLRESKHELNLVMACDIPRVDSDFVNELLRSAGDVDAVVPRQPDGRVEPLLAVYRREPVLAAAEVALNAGQRRMTELLERLKVHYVPMAMAGGWYRNMNTPEDYREAQHDLV